MHVHQVVAVGAFILLNILAFIELWGSWTDKINDTSCKTDCSRAGRQYIGSVHPHK